MKRLEKKISLQQLFGGKTMRQNQALSIFPLTMTTFLSMQKVLSHGVQISCHAQISKTPYTRILIMTHAVRGVLTICLRGIITVRERILSSVQAAELLKVPPMVRTGDIRRKSFGKWTEMDESGGVKMEIMFQHLKSTFQKSSRELCRKPIGLMKK